MSENRVAEMRHRMGLRQAEMAARAGLTQGAVSNLETGQREGTVATRHAIVRALGLPYEAVFPIDRESDRETSH